MIKSITTVAKKNKLCVVYDAPNYEGKIKTFCLAMRLAPDAFASFTQLSTERAPGVAQEGRLKAVNGVLLYVVLVLLLGVLAIGAMKFLGSSAATHP